jgi:hypothetical protein
LFFVCFLFFLLFFSLCDATSVVARSPHVHQQPLQPLPNQLRHAVRHSFLSCPPSYHALLPLLFSNSIVSTPMMLFPASTKMRSFVLAGSWQPASQPVDPRYVGEAKGHVDAKFGLAGVRKIRNFCRFHFL